MSAKNVDIANTYMKLRNSYKHGFMKYYYFKRIISHCTGVTDGMKIRAIFQKMLDDELIEVTEEVTRQKKTSLRYRFNPYHIETYRFYEPEYKEEKKDDK